MSEEECCLSWHSDWHRGSVGWQLWLSVTALGKERTREREIERRRFGLRPLPKCATGLDLLSCLLMTDSAWLLLQFAVWAPIFLAYHVTSTRLDVEKQGKERKMVGMHASVRNGRRAKWRLWQRRILGLEDCSGECCLPREGGRSRYKKRRDVERKTAEEGRVDLGKGQRHLPTPSDCHPSSHRSHIKLKDWLWGGSCQGNRSGCHGDCYVWKIRQ